MTTISKTRGATLTTFCFYFSLYLVPYTEVIPVGGPPSFNGHFVHYVYKLTVGVQKPSCPAQITRLPVRVILIPGKLSNVYMVNVTFQVDHLMQPMSASPQSSNPFLVSEESQSASELGLEAIALESCKRNTGKSCCTSKNEKPHYPI